MSEVALMKKTFSEKLADVMPKGAGALFFIQIFSILAYSVLYSTLVLYTTHKLKMSDSIATAMTATFVAFNYALHLLGGYLGGRYISYRSLFLIGMATIAVGCIVITIPSLNCLYWGLATFLIGAGMNVTCINCMLTQLFQPSDSRREAAFLWNYSGMNLGFFIGFSISGFFQLTGNYQELFLISSAGSLIAIILTLFKWRTLKDLNTKLVSLSRSDQRRAYIKGLCIIAGLLLGLRWILENSHFSNNLIMIVGLLMACVIIYLAVSQPSTEQRKKLWAFFVLALTSIVFWTLYQLAPMGLTLFIERNVDRHFWGITVAPQWVQNINTIVIIIGGPLFGIWFNALRARGLKITLPVQFSIALFLIGTAFSILPIGIHFADAKGLTSFGWIAACFILQSLGELFISPIGYAMVGQLAPPQLQGLLMGTWMMITGVAATLSGYFSNIALGTAHAVDPLVTNSSFSYTFSLLGCMAIGMGVVLLILIPFVLRLTQEKHIALQTNILPATNT